MSQIQIALDENVTQLLGNSLEEIERTVAEMVVLELYRRGQLSVSRAAQFLGLDQLSFIRWSGALGVPFFDLTPEEWQQELRAIESI